MTLEAGWNGHNSQRMTDPALAVLANLHAVPRSNGGIQIEWHVNGQDVEISVSAEGRVEAFWFENVSSVSAATADTDETKGGDHG